MAGRTYRYFTGKSAYPFGFGLSYNDYRYAGLTATRDAQGIHAWVEVTNQGRMAGCETVQAYIQWIAPASAMPNLQLAAVEKLSLAPGETRRVALDIPEAALRVCDDQGEFHPHRGSICVYVGGVQPDEVCVEKGASMPLCMMVEGSDAELSF